MVGYQQRIENELRKLGYDEAEAKKFAAFLVHRIARYGEHVADVDAPEQATSISPVNAIGPFQLHADFWKTGYKNLSNVPDDYYKDIKQPTESTPTEKLVTDFPGWYVKTVAAAADDIRRTARVSKEDLARADKEAIRRYAIAWNAGAKYLNVDPDQLPEETKKFINNVTSPPLTEEESGASAWHRAGLPDLVNRAKTHKQIAGEIKEKPVTAEPAPIGDRPAGVRDRPATVEPPPTRQSAWQEAGLPNLKGIAEQELTGQPVMPHAGQQQATTLWQQAGLPDLAGIARLSAAREGAKQIGAGVAPTPQPHTLPQILVEDIANRAGPVGASPPKALTPNQQQVINAYLNAIREQYGLKKSLTADRQNGSLAISYGEQTATVPLQSAAAFAAKPLSSMTLHSLVDRIIAPVRSVDVSNAPSIISSSDEAFIKLWPHTKADGKGPPIMSLDAQDFLRDTLTRQLANFYKGTGKKPPTVEITPDRRDKNKPLIEQGYRVSLVSSDGKRENIYIDQPTMKRLVIATRGMLYAASTGTIPQFQGDKISLAFPGGENVVSSFPVTDLLSFPINKAGPEEEHRKEVVQKIREIQLEKLPEGMLSRRGLTRLHLPSGTEELDTTVQVNRDKALKPFEPATLLEQNPLVVYRFAEEFQKAEGDPEKIRALNNSFSEWLDRQNKILSTNFAIKARREGGTVAKAGATLQEWLDQTLGTLGVLGSLGQLIATQGGITSEVPASERAGEQFIKYRLRLARYFPDLPQLAQVVQGHTSEAFTDLPESPEGEGYMALGPSTANENVNLALSFVNPLEFALWGKVAKGLGLAGRGVMKLSKLSGLTDFVMSKVPAKTISALHDAVKNEATNVLRKQLAQELGELPRFGPQFKEALRRFLPALGAKEALSEAGPISKTALRLATEGLESGEVKVATGKLIEESGLGGLSKIVTNEINPILQRTKNLALEAANGGELTREELAALKEGMKLLSGDKATVVAHVANQPNGPLSFLSWAAFNDATSQGTKKGLAAFAAYLDDIGSILGEETINFGRANLKGRIFDNLRARALKVMLANGGKTGRYLTKGGTEIVLPKSVAAQIGKISLLREGLLGVALPIGIQEQEMEKVGQTLTLDQAAQAVLWTALPMIGFASISPLVQFSQSLYRRHAVKAKPLVSEQQMALQLALKFTELGIDADVSYGKAFDILADTHTSLARYFAVDQIRRIQARLSVETESTVRAQLEKLKTSYEKFLSKEGENAGRVLEARKQIIEPPEAGREPTSVPERPTEPISRPAETEPSEPIKREPTVTPPEETSTPTTLAEKPPGYQEGLIPAAAVRPPEGQPVGEPTPPGIQPAGAVQPAGEPPVAVGPPVTPATSIQQPGPEFHYSGQLGVGSRKVLGLRNVLQAITHSEKTNQMFLGLLGGGEGTYDRLTIANRSIDLSHYYVSYLRHLFSSANGASRLRKELNNARQIIREFTAEGQPVPMLNALENAIRYDREVGARDAAGDELARVLRARYNMAQGHIDLEGTKVKLFGLTKQEDLFTTKNLADSPYAKDHLNMELNPVAINAPMQNESFSVSEALDQFYSQAPQKAADVGGTRPFEYWLARNLNLERPVLEDALNRSWINVPKIRIGEPTISMNGRTAKGSYENLEDAKLITNLASSALIAITGRENKILDAAGINARFRVSLPKIQDGGLNLSLRTYRDEGSFTNLGNKQVITAAKNLRDGLSVISKMAETKNVSGLERFIEKWTNINSADYIEGMEIEQNHAANMFGLSADRAVNSITHGMFGYFPEPQMALLSPEIRGDITEGNMAVDRMALKLINAVDDGLDPRALDLLQPVYDPQYFPDGRLPPAERETILMNLANTATDLGIEIGSNGYPTLSSFREYLAEHGMNASDINALEKRVPVMTQRGKKRLPVGNQVGFWLAKGRNKAASMNAETRQKLSDALIPSTFPIKRFFPDPSVPMARRHLPAEEAMRNLEAMGVPENERPERPENVRSPETKLTHNIMKLMVEPRRHMFDGLGDPEIDGLREAIKNVAFGAVPIPLFLNGDDDDNKGLATGLSLLALGGMFLAGRRGRLRRGIEIPRANIREAPQQTAELLMGDPTMPGKGGGILDFFNPKKIPVGAPAEGEIRDPSARFTPDLRIAGIARAAKRWANVNPLGILLDKSIPAASVRNALVRGDFNLGDAVTQLKSEGPTAPIEATSPFSLIYGLTTFIGKHIDSIKKRKEAPKVEVFMDPDIQIGGAARRGEKVPMMSAEEKIYADVLNLINDPSKNRQEVTEGLKAIYDAPIEKAKSDIRYIDSELAENKTELDKLPQPIPSQEERPRMTVEMEKFQNLRAQAVEAHQEVQKITKEIGRFDKTSAEVEGRLEQKQNQLAKLRTRVRQLQEQFDQTPETDLATIEQLYSERQGAETRVEQLIFELQQLTPETEARSAGAIAKRERLVPKLDNAKARLAQINNLIAQAPPELTDALAAINRPKSPAEINNELVERNKQKLENKIKTLEQDRAQRKEIIATFTKLREQIVDDPKTGKRGLLSELERNMRLTRTGIARAFAQTLTMGGTEIETVMSQRALRIMMMNDLDAWRNPLRGISTSIDIANEISKGKESTQPAYRFLGQLLRNRVGTVNAAFREAGIEPTAMGLATAILDFEKIMSFTKEAVQAQKHFERFANEKPGNAFPVNDADKNAAGILADLFINDKQKRQELVKIRDNQTGTVDVNESMAEMLANLDMAAQKIITTELKPNMAREGLEKVAGIATMGVLRNVEDIIYDQILKLSRPGGRKKSFESALPEAVLNAYMDKKLAGVRDINVPFPPFLRSYWRNAAKIGQDPRFTLKREGEGELSTDLREPIYSETLNPFAMFGDANIGYTAYTGIDPMITPGLVTMLPDNRKVTIPRLMTIHQAINGSKATKAWEIGQSFFFDNLDSRPVQSFGMLRGMLEMLEKNNEFATSEGLVRFFFGDQKPETVVELRTYFEGQARAAGLKVEDGMISLGDAQTPMEAGEMINLMREAVETTAHLSSLFSGVGYPETEAARAGAVLVGAFKDKTPAIRDLPPSKIVTLTMQELRDMSSSDGEGRKAILNLMRDTEAENLNATGLDKDLPLFEHILDRPVTPEELETMDRVWQAAANIAGPDATAQPGFANYLNHLSLIGPERGAAEPLDPAVESNLNAESFRHKRAKNVSLQHNSYMSLYKSLNGGETDVPDMVSSFMGMQDVFGRLDPDLQVSVMVGSESLPSSKTLATGWLERATQDLNVGRPKALLKAIDKFDQRALSAGMPEISPSAIADLGNAVNWLSTQGKEVASDLYGGIVAGIETANNLTERVIAEPDMQKAAALTDQRDAALGRATRRTRLINQLGDELTALSEKNGIPIIQLVKGIERAFDQGDMNALRKLMAGTTTNLQQLAEYVHGDPTRLPLVEDTVRAIEEQLHDPMSSTPFPTDKPVATVIETYIDHYLSQMRGVDPTVTTNNRSNLVRIATESGLLERLLSGELIDNPEIDLGLRKTMSDIGPDLVQTMTENVRAGKFDPIFELKLMQRTVDNRHLQVPKLFDLIAEMLVPYYGPGEKNVQQIMAKNPLSYMDITGTIGQTVLSSQKFHQMRGLNTRSVDGSIARRFLEWMRVNKDTVYEDILEHLGDRRGDLEDLIRRDPALKNRLLTLIGLPQFLENPDPQTHRVGKQIVQTVDDLGLLRSQVPPTRSGLDFWGAAPALPALLGTGCDDDNDEHCKQRSNIAIALMMLPLAVIGLRRRAGRVANPAEVMQQQEAMNWRERFFRGGTMVNFYPQNMIRAATALTVVPLLERIQQIHQYLTINVPMRRFMEDSLGKIASGNIPIQERPELKSQIDRVRGLLNRGTPFNKLTKADQVFATHAILQENEAGSLVSYMMRLYNRLSDAQTQALADTNGPELTRAILQYRNQKRMDEVPPSDQLSGLELLARKMADSLDYQTKFITPSMFLQPGDDVPIWQNIAESFSRYGKLMRPIGEAVEAAATKIRRAAGADVERIDEQLVATVEAAANGDLAGKIGQWASDTRQRFVSDPGFLAVPRLRITPDKAVIGFDKVAGWKGLMAGFSEERNEFLFDRARRVVDLANEANPELFKDFNPASDLMMIQIESGEKSQINLRLADQQILVLETGNTLRVEFPDNPAKNKIFKTADDSIEIQGREFNYDFFKGLLMHSGSLSSIKGSAAFHTLPVLSRLKLGPSQLESSVEQALAQLFSGKVATAQDPTGASRAGIFRKIQHPGYNVVLDDLNYATEKTTGGRGTLGEYAERIRGPEKARKINSLFTSATIATLMSVYGSAIGNNVQFLRMFEPFARLMAPKGISLMNLAKSLLMVDSIIYPEAMKRGGKLAGLTMLTNPFTAFEATQSLVQKMIGGRTGKKLSQFIRKTKSGWEVQIENHWLPMIDAIKQIEPNWELDSLGHLLRQEYVRDLGDLVGGGLALAKEERTHPKLTVASELGRDLTNKVVLRLFKNYSEVRNRAITPLTAFLAARLSGINESEAINLARQMQVETNISHSTLQRSPFLSLRQFGRQPSGGSAVQEAVRAATFLTSTGVQLTMSSLRSWGDSFRQWKRLGMGTPEGLQYARRAATGLILPMLMFGVGGSGILLPIETLWQGYRWLTGGVDNDNQEIPHSFIDWLAENTGAGSTGRLLTMGLLGNLYAKGISGLGSLVMNQNLSAPDIRARVSLVDNVTNLLFGMAHDAQSPGLVAAAGAIYRPATVFVGLQALLKGAIDTVRGKPGHPLLIGASRLFPSYIAARAWGEIMDSIGEKDSEFSRKLKEAIFSAITQTRSEKYRRSARAVHRVAQARRKGRTESYYNVDRWREMIQQLFNPDSDNPSLQDNESLRLGATSTILDLIRNRLSRKAHFGYRELGVFHDMIRRVPRGVIGTDQLIAALKTFGVDPDILNDEDAFFNLSEQKKSQAMFVVISGLMQLDQRNLAQAAKDLPADKREMLERSMVVLRSLIDRNNFYRQFHVEHLPNKLDKNVKQEQLQAALRDIEIVSRLGSVLPDEALDIPMAKPTITKMLRIMRNMQFDDEGTRKTNFTSAAVIAEVRKALKLFEQTAERRAEAADYGYVQAVRSMPPDRVAKMLQPNLATPQGDVNAAIVDRNNDFIKIARSYYETRLYRSLTEEDRQAARDIDWPLIQKALDEADKAVLAGSLAVSEHLENIGLNEQRQ